MFLQSHLSTEREVVLDNVDFSTSGQYRCDVSGDAPMFQTDSIEGLLFVVGESCAYTTRNGNKYAFPFSDKTEVENPSLIRSFPSVMPREAELYLSPPPPQRNATFR